MFVSRRHFLKCCAGSTALAIDLAVLAPLEKVLAGENGLHEIESVENGLVAGKGPTYPIDTDVITTLDRMVYPIVPPPLPAGATLLPCDVSQYATYGYGQWQWSSSGFPYILVDMDTGENSGTAVRDPSNPTLLSFFSISDYHITDKESPAQVIYYGYQGGILASNAEYSAVMLSTTQVLDAAIQTINALHQKDSFDFGISLGDVANYTQFNEVRWFINVLDGKMITPSSGAHRGAKTIDYQKPFQAAGLDKSIGWYQAVGNHDQFWAGGLRPNSYIRKTLVGSKVLNFGELPPNEPGGLSERGFYMGVINGATEYGDVIDAGPVDYFSTPPTVAADPRRRSLTIRDWMGEFSNTTSTPVGHGFRKKVIDTGTACYHFYPKADLPIKVIVLDDTDKAGSPNGALDYERYDWLVNELDEGESAGELMIICAHVPIQPYAHSNPNNLTPYPRMTTFAKYSLISEQTLLNKLHTYKNLILWIAGHEHRNTITPQPASNGDPEYGFWEVETPSLRDLPQQFRRIDIVRNSDNNISIFALDVDPAVVPLQDGTSPPALKSRSYAIAAQQIFQTAVAQGPNMDPVSGVYNAELVKVLSAEMQAKIAQLSPVITSFKINGGAASSKSADVTLNNAAGGTRPTEYMASEDPGFSGAAWLAYSTTPSFTLSPARGVKTVYFKVRDASGKESAVATDKIRRVPK